MSSKSATPTEILPIRKSIDTCPNLSKSSTSMGYLMA